MESKIKEILIGVTETIMKMMGFDVSVEVLESGGEKPPTHIVSIKTQDDSGILIGKNGQNIKTLEYLIRVLTHKKLPENAGFVLDVNEYRKSRAGHIIEQVRLVASRVKATRKAEALSPMSSYERRIVHMELASLTDVITESIGEEPHRRVVIKPLI